MEFFLKEDQLEINLGSILPGCFSIPLGAAALLSGFASLWILTTTPPLMALFPVLFALLFSALVVCCFNKNGIILDRSKGLYIRWTGYGENRKVREVIPFLEFEKLRFHYRPAQRASSSKNRRRPPAYLIDLHSESHPRTLIEFLKYEPALAAYKKLCEFIPMPASDEIPARARIIENA